MKWWAWWATRAAPASIRIPSDMLYIPLWQRPQNSSSILVRTGMDPKSIASALRAAGVERRWRRARPAGAYA